MFFFFFVRQTSQTISWIHEEGWRTVMKNCGSEVLKNQYLYFWLTVIARDDIASLEWFNNGYTELL